jgi:hypothetical protein
MFTHTPEDIYNMVNELKSQVEEYKTKLKKEE